MIARLVALGFAATAALVVLFPLPFTDLLAMIPVQFLLVMVMRKMSGQSLHPLGAGKLVIGYALIGTVLSFLVANLIPFVGKLFVAPFAALWCYGLAEITLWSSRRSS